MKTRLFTLFVLVVTLLSSAAGLQAQGQPPAPSSDRQGPAGVKRPPAQPDELGLSFVSQFGGAVYDSAVVGNTLYVGVGLQLMIMDVTDPAAPVILGQTHSFPNEVGCVTVAGSYAYVGVYEYGMAVVDVSDPANPLLVGSFISQASVEHMTLDGNHLYCSPL